MPNDDTKSPALAQPDRALPSQLVSVESQREFDLFTGQRTDRTFLKLYVEARSSGLLAAISDRDWKTLCTLATYMNADGYCFPSQAELARALGCSRQMANARIKSLAEFRFQGKPVMLVEREGRSEQGTWARNGYHILPIASLGIFDDEQPSTDRRKTQRPRWAQARQEAPHSTVSRSLDMEETVSRTVDTVSDTTVSSATVPVQLDTNKNQTTNQKEISLSNIRTASMPQVGEGRPLDPNVPEALGATIGQRRRQRQAQPAPDGSERDVILEYIADFSREFADRAPLKSSTTRAYNLYRQSGVALETFIEGMYRARAIVKERTAVIRAASDSTAQTGATKNKMAYWFSVLEDLLGLRADGSAVSTPPSRS